MQDFIIKFVASSSNNKKGDFGLLFYAVSNQGITKLPTTGMAIMKPKVTAVIIICCLVSLFIFLSFRKIVK